MKTAAVSTGISAQQPGNALGDPLSTPGKTPDLKVIASVAQREESFWRILWRALGAFLILGWLALMALSWVEAAQASDDPQYDFSWLDPDKQVHVLQNRRYRKALHPLITVAGGTAMNDPFRTSFLVEPRATFHLSEQFAVEGFFALYFNSTNTLFDAISIASPNALPTMREARSRYGGLLQWSPWYAKINVFNSILYFDWHFGAGAGVLNTALDTRTSTSVPASYRSESQLGVILNTGHLYHVNEWFKVRLDVTTTFYNATITQTGTETDWYTDTAFTLGVGVQL